MKAPKYQRAELLDAALREAVQTMEDPVEGLAITDKGVIAWAAGRYILMTYRWDNDHAEGGEPLLGGGAWLAEYVADCDASALPSRGDHT
jgi:hypothetical protein